MWCEQKGLKDLADAEFTIVCQRDPGREAAWKKLGYFRQKGKWTTAAKVAAERAEAEAQRKADARWRPLIQTWKANGSARTSRRVGTAGVKIRGRFRRSGRRLRREAQGRREARRCLCRVHRRTAGNALAGRGLRTRPTTIRAGCHRDSRSSESHGHSHRLDQLTCCTTRSRQGRNGLGGNTAGLPGRRRRVQRRRCHMHPTASQIGQASSNSYPMALSSRSSRSPPPLAAQARAAVRHCRQHADFHLRLHLGPPGDLSAKYRATRRYNIDRPEPSIPASADQHQFSTGSRTRSLQHADQLCQRRQRDRSNRHDPGNECSPGRGLRRVSSKDLGEDREAAAVRVLAGDVEDTSTYRLKTATKRPSTCRSPPLFSGSISPGLCQQQWPPAASSRPITI